MIQTIAFAGSFHRPQDEGEEEYEEEEHVNAQKGGEAYNEEGEQEQQRARQPRPQHQLRPLPSTPLSRRIACLLPLSHRRCVGGGGLFHRYATSRFTSHRFHTEDAACPRTPQACSGIPEKFWRWQRACSWWQRQQCRWHQQT